MITGCILVFHPGAAQPVSLWPLSTLADCAWAVYRGERRRYRCESFRAAWLCAMKPLPQHDPLAYHTPWPSL